MNAGLPGTGLGGLFYIASAFLMPLRMLRDANRKRRIPEGGAAIASPTAAGRLAERRRVRVLPLIAIAAGILASLFATGWLLGHLLPQQAQATRLGIGSAALEVQSVVRWASVVGTAGLLALLLAIVEVASVLTRRPARLKAGARSAAADPDSPRSAERSRRSKVA